ncbi:hypothetical protein QP223_11350, partial [Streptococcus agalactiae]|nr:hypothetical protein [Streptococcus agalactiae]
LVLKSSLVKAVPRTATLSCECYGRNEVITGSRAFVLYRGMSTLGKTKKTTVCMGEKWHWELTLNHRDL